MQGTSQEPVTWSGIANHTIEGVCGLVSQDWWDKVKRLIREFLDMEDKGERGLERYKME